MYRYIKPAFIGFVLTFCILYIAASFGGNFTPGSGGVIGFSVGFSRIYTRDNSMFSFDMWLLLISCILGGACAGFQV